jgi:hypothetical protein
LGWTGRGCRRVRPSSCSQTPIVFT